MGGIVILSLDPLVVTDPTTRYYALMETISILMINYEDVRAGTENPGRYRDTDANIFLLLVHHFTGIMRKEPIGFIRPVISGGLYKYGEIVSRHLRYIISDNATRPQVSMFSVLHIP